VPGEWVVGGEACENVEAWGGDIASDLHVEVLYADGRGEAVESIG
jgi:hypothetical protein